MPRSSLEALVEDRLSEGGGGRSLDVCIDLMRCMCEEHGCGRGRPEHLLAVGGRWDRVAKEYRGRAERSRRFTLQDAQMPAARWFARWLLARRARQHVLGPDGTPCFTLALVGGRRGGKSDLSPKLPITYLVENPRSIAWLVVPKYPDMPELEASLDGLLPRAWYTALGDPWYQWTLANGSRLEIRSSYDPADLKRGRCDVAVIHEAQKHDERTYAMLRPAIADKGGLVILAANPPDSARGEWVAELVSRARAGKTDEQVFEVDPKLNPHVDHAALNSLKKIFDQRTYEIEILGSFLPRKDTVFYAFSPSEKYGNVRPMGTGEKGEPLVEVTQTFLARKFGVPAARLHGIDFGKDQHMAAVTLRFFEDPDDPAGPPLFWFTDAIILEQGNEWDLVNTLEAHGHTADDICVIDASGEWQDAERTKGRASADIFRQRTWHRLFLPDENMRKNPDVSERVASMNALFRNAEGKRRAFVDPAVPDLIRAFRLLDVRFGKPNKNSQHMHVCDGATYPAYRLFPRRAPNQVIEYSRVEREPSARRRDLEVL